MNTRLKTLVRYVVPAVSSMVVSFAYVVVDGVFVGRGVGANALAAVNIALPFNVMTTAVASLLAIGGATVFAIRRGRGDRTGANEAFLASGVMVVAASLTLTAVGVFLASGIAALSGATPILMEDTSVYLKYYSMFTAAFSLSQWLSAFVRNDGRPGLAFVGMVAGALANVFLDWLFVFPLGMGIMGAAVASGLGQVLSLAILATHFIGNKGVVRLRLARPSPALMGKILKRGVPEMITQLYHPLSIFCYNLIAIETIGEMGVAAYSVITYIASLFIGVFLGVSQGIQPLIGNCFGRGEKRDAGYYFRAGMIINFTLSLFLYVAMVIGGKWVYAIFNPDAELISMAETIWLYNAPGFILASVNIVYTTYFFSTKQTRSAVIVAASRSLVLNTACIFLFPMLFASEYMWLAIVVSEVVTIALAFALKNHELSEYVDEVCRATVEATRRSGALKSGRFIK